MRDKLINQQQPFGQRADTPMHSSTIANKAPERNVPGRTTAVGNNGQTKPYTVNTGNVPGSTVGVSFSDPNPNAYNQACAGRDNPFGPVGKNFGTGKVNLTEFKTNSNT